MAHALLVVALHDAQPAGVRVQRLAEADRDAVAEDREETFHELRFLAVH